MSQDFRIFNINNQLDFNELALKIFYYQAENVEVYKKYLYYLGIEPKSIDHVEAIPFLPIRFPSWSSLRLPESLQTGGGDARSR